MTEKHYAIVIDTTQYTGNFSREMSAYMTGRTVDGYRGHEFARLASGKIENKEWLNNHLIEKMATYEEISRCHYSHIFLRRYVELPTDYIYSFLERYNSIIFFFDEYPPIKVVEELVDRAKYFASNLNEVYENAGKSYSLTDQSFDFSSAYSLLKGTNKTLDVVDVRFFEVSKAIKLYEEKDPYTPIKHEFVFIRSEESFMLEHKLKKASTEKEVQNYKDKIKGLNRKERNLVNSYFNDDINDYEVNINQIMFLLYKVDYFIDDGLSIDELNEYYKSFDIQLQKIKGECELTKNMYAVPHDDVQYAIKQVLQNYKIEKNVKTYNYIIEKHHAKIKEICEHFNSRNVKDIWVYCDMNGSITATFGNKDGVLAMIELGEEDSIYKKTKKLKVFNLIVSKKNQDNYFLGNEIKDINLKTKRF